MFKLLGTSDYTKKSMLILDSFYLLFILIVFIIDVYISTDISTILLLLGIVSSMVLFFFHSKFEGINDELTEKIISKVNEECIKYMIPVLTFIGIFLTQRELFSIFFSSIEVVGIVIISSMFIFSVLRVILFIYYERKGIYY